jgi:hypothetical protein
MMGRMTEAPTADFLLPRLRRDSARLAIWIFAGWMVLQEILLVPRRAPYPIGLDARAYWDAWRQHLYDQNLTHTIGRYLYSPAFAEVIRPATMLPWHLFAPLWSLLMLAAYAWLLAPLQWRWRVPVFLSLGLDDVLLGNIHGLLAVALVLSVRYPAAWAFPLLTKPPLGVGMLSYVGDRNWRGLLQALGVTGAVLGVSFAFSPHLWSAWFRLLTAGQVRPAGGTSLFVVRLVIGGTLCFLAARSGRHWLLPLGVFVAAPIFGIAGLGLLAAIPRLLDESRDPSARVRMARPDGRPAQGQGVAAPALQPARD